MTALFQRKKRAATVFALLCRDKSRTWTATPDVPKKSDDGWNPRHGASFHSPSRYEGQSDHLDGRRIVRVKTLIFVELAAKRSGIGNLWHG